MYPLTQDQSDAYLLRLTQICDDMGLSVDGTTVVVGLSDRISIDASCINLENAAECLLTLAYRMGRADAGSIK